MTLRRLCAVLCCLGLVLVGCGDDDKDESKGEAKSICELTEIMRRDMAKRDATYSDLVNDKPSREYAIGMGAQLYLMAPSERDIPEDYRPVIGYLIDTLRAYKDETDPPDSTDKVKENARKLDERVEDC